MVYLFDYNSFARIFLVRNTTFPKNESETPCILIFMKIAGAISEIQITCMYILCIQELLVCNKIFWIWIGLHYSLLTICEYAYTSVDTK